MKENQIPFSPLEITKKYNVSKIFETKLLNAETCSNPATLARSALANHRVGDIVKITIQARWLANAER